MKASECIEVVASIKTLWTRFEVQENTAEAYYLGIGDLDYRAMAMVVAELAKTEEWPPTIAKLRKAYYESAGVPNQYKAWASVVAMGKLSPQNVNHLYERMDPLTVVALREVGGLILYWQLSGPEKIADMKREFFESYQRYYRDELAKPELSKERLEAFGHKAQLEAQLESSNQPQANSGIRSIVEGQH